MNLKDFCGDFILSGNHYISLVDRKHYQILYNSKGFMYAKNNKSKKDLTPEFTESLFRLGGKQEVLDLAQQLCEDEGAYFKRTNVSIKEFLENIKGL